MKYNITPHKEIQGMNFYNCDCMELLGQTPDNYYDLAIVDPPYGIERFKSKGDDRHNLISLKKASSFNDNKPTKRYWDELFRVSKNQIVWGANNFELPTSEYFCVWDKKQPMDNFARCELAYVSMGLKKPAKIFEYRYYGSLEGGEVGIGRIHPTQKPVKLYEWLLKNYAKEGDKILDTHLGSGSIAIACHYAGYDLTACELDEEYFNQSIERIINQTKQLSLI